MRRLKQVGRVQRAQELVAKDRYIAANRPLQRHLNADAVRKPTQLRPARKWRTENDLKQVRKTIAGATVPHAEQALQSAIKRAEQASKNSQLRIVKGVHDGQINHPGTINNTLPSRDYIAMTEAITEVSESQEPAVNRLIKKMMPHMPEDAADMCGYLLEFASGDELSPPLPGEYSRLIELPNFPATAH